MLTCSASLLNRQFSTALFSFWIITYFTDTSRDIEMIECLNKFPTILKLSLKYNTPLSPSAPVERLLSLGGQILVPRRNRLTDAPFERKLLVRTNKTFLFAKIYRPSEVWLKDIFGHLILLCSIDSVKWTNNIVQVNWTLLLRTNIIHMILFVWYSVSSMTMLMQMPATWSHHSS